MIGWGDGVHPGGWRGVVEIFRENVWVVLRVSWRRCIGVNRGSGRLCEGVCGPSPQYSHPERPWQIEGVECPRIRQAIRWTLTNVGR
jgi:hypothetical protein